MRVFLAFSSGAAVAICLAGAALAQPSIPATFFGSVTIDGKPAEAGVEVRAFVAGVDCTQAAPGTRPVIRDGEIAAYVLHVVHESQRPGCARDGVTVTFTIAGISAAQEAPWKPGPNRLDLSTGTASPIPLPSPTGTIAAAITAAAGTQAPGTAATLARPSGTPPTDDVRFDLTPASARTPLAPESGADDGDGSSLTPLLVMGLAVLASAGGFAGVLLSRRRSRAVAGGNGA